MDHDEVRTDIDGTSDYDLTRTWTARDHCGNTHRATQTIAVRDTQAPTLVGVPQDASVPAHAVPEECGVTARDNCDQDIEVIVTETITKGDCQHNYTLIRTWTATDGAGNVATATQHIQVYDNTPPVLVGAPTNSVNFQCAVSTAPIVTATDNADNKVEVIFTETLEQGDNFITVTRTWTATDACGNSVSKTQQVFVKDTESPTLFGVPSSDLEASCAPCPWVGPAGRAPRRA
jgi:hypothetical protein